MVIVFTLRNLTSKYCFWTYFYEKNSYVRVLLNLDNYINLELSSETEAQSSNSQKQLTSTKSFKQKFIFLSELVQLTVHSQQLQHVLCLVPMATSTTSDVDQFTFNIVKRRTMQKVCSDRHVTKHAACLSQ